MKGRDGLGIRTSAHPLHGHAAKQAVAVAVEVVQFGNFDALGQETAGEDSEKHSCRRPGPVNPPALPLPGDDRRAKAARRICACA